MLSLIQILSDVGFNCTSGKERLSRSSLTKHQSKMLHNIQPARSRTGDYGEGAKSPTKDHQVLLRLRRHRQKSPLRSPDLQLLQSLLPQNSPCGQRPVLQVLVKRSYLSTIIVVMPQCRGCCSGLIVNLVA